MEGVQRVNEYRKHLLAKDAYTLPKLCVFLLVLCCSKTKSYPRPHRDRVIGFQGEVPANAFGGINVPAAPEAFILFSVPRLVLHFVFVLGNQD